LKGYDLFDSMFLLVAHTFYSDTVVG